MKKITTIISIILLCVNFSIAQVVTQCNGVINPSNRLWQDFTQDLQQPAMLPAPIPIDIDYAGLVKKVINPDYTELKNAIENLTANEGGVISFKNIASNKTIFFDEPIEINNSPSRPCVTILIEGANKVTFDGGKSSSVFVIRKSVKVIIQNTIFQDARLKREIIQNRQNFRVGGGAIEITAGAALRVYSCTFADNTVDEWDDIPGGGYTGVGENQNGAAIRFNYHTTGEIFKCTFLNNKAVTGGAIGATSINKLTIMDSSFDKNISTSYNTKNSTKRRIPEGAGALRVDRTAKPLEIYRTHFKENAANLKASVMEVFIRPLRDNGTETGPYPNLSQFALIIDDCIFENNKYYNFEGANDPERGDFFAGCLLFHGGRLDANFNGAKMKITNSKFIGNEIGESNIRALMEFEISNSLFANTKVLRIKDKNGKFRIGKGALMLRGEPNKGAINNCTFYNNEPHPQDPKNQSIASDIHFWNGTQEKYTLNNSIFYRSNKNNRIKQVSHPIAGSGNNQFIPGADMSLFSNVSTSSVDKTDPNIIPNSITDMCLGQNTLIQGIGGLDDCDTINPSSFLEIPGTIQAESFTTKNGSVGIARIPGTSRKNLGFIRNGDYVEYEVKVNTGGIYKIDAYVSSNGVGGTLHFFMNTDNLGAVNATVNNAWHSYIKISKEVILNAGIQKLKLNFEGDNGYLYNIDRLMFSKIDASRNISIETNNTTEKITLHPNPTSGFFDIASTYNTDVTIKNVDLYSIHGNLIKNLQSTASNYDVKNIPKGVYILRFTIENTVTQEKSAQVVKLVKE